jgi:hypothetical protein
VWIFARHRCSLTIIERYRSTALRAFAAQPRTARRKSVSICVPSRNVGTPTHDLPG